MILNSIISSWWSLNYTLLIVAAGTSLLCMASGVVGTFTYLRKRALIGDVISHSVLPGVTVAFMLSGVKNPVYFIIGALVSGLLSVWLVDVVQKRSKLKPDTILALVLSVFFGIGIVFLTYVQHQGNAAQSGLDHFLFGKAASMNLMDVKVFGLVALLNLVIVITFRRGFSILSFDEGYSKAIGLRVNLLKNVLATLTVATVAIGVQAVGVVLMAALLITPAAGARFLTNNIQKMMFYSGVIGALSGLGGAIISSVGVGMPTGPWIVLCLSVLALASILFGTNKGLLARIRLRNENIAKINNENVLKEVYKQTSEGTKPISFNDLIELRNHAADKYKKIIKGLERKGYVSYVKGNVLLSEVGVLAAREVVRKHRLWELYLSKYFNLDVDHLHDDAEGIEHVITPEIEKHLTKLLNYPDKDPHESEIPY